MKGSRTSRLIVGLVLVAAAVALLLFTEGDSYTTGAIVLGVLGLISVAISRKK